MKDKSNQPPKTPQEERLERLKRIDKAFEICDENEAQGISFEDYRELNVESEVERELASGKIFVNEQDIREKLIQQENRIIKRVLNKNRLERQKQYNAYEKVLIHEEEAKAKRIVFLNEIEQRVRKKIDRIKLVDNEQLRLIADSINSLTQKKPSDEEDDN